METTYLVAILALITLLAGIVFALVSKHRVEKRMADDTAEKSTLAADAPNSRS